MNTGINLFTYFLVDSQWKKQENKWFPYHNHKKIFLHAIVIFDVPFGGKRIFHK